MGVSKLTLPWKNSTVIEHVLQAWIASDVDQIVVVVGPANEALARLCRNSKAHVVIAPQQPPDMKASVSLGLRFVEDQFVPQADDAWLLAPADMPLLTADLINQVLSVWKQAPRGDPPRCYVPEYQGRR